MVPLPDREGLFEAQPPVALRGGPFALEGGIAGDGDGRQAGRTASTIRGFELVTARVRDADSAEGVGYTYTVGTGGAAVHALIARDLAPRLAGRQAEDIEALWQAMWWALHYGGRGGAQALAISAVDIALWDLRARRQGAPLWRVLGGFDPRVPCYAGGIDLELPLDALLRQTDDNLARGFRAIKMKVGRPSSSKRRSGWPKAWLSRSARSTRSRVPATTPPRPSSRITWSA